MSTDVESKTERKYLRGVLRRIFEPKRQEVTERKYLHNQKYLNLQPCTSIFYLLLLDHMKKKEVDEIYSV
jgi:hypothetical protein